MAEFESGAGPVDSAVLVPDSRQGHRRVARWFSRGAPGPSPGALDHGRSRHQLVAALASVVLAEAPSLLLRDVGHHLLDVANLGLEELAVAINVNELFRIHPHQQAPPRASFAKFANGRGRLSSPLNDPVSLSVRLGHRPGHAVAGMVGTTFFASVRASSHESTSPVSRFEAGLLRLNSRLPPCIETSTVQASLM